MLIFGETHHPTERSPLLTYESAKSGGDRETGCPEGRAAKFGTETSVWAVLIPKLGRAAVVRVHSGRSTPPVGGTAAVR